jgi:hypothetical protein
MIKFFKYVLDEEQHQVKSTAKNPLPKGLTPEIIRQIERDYLGI